MESEDGKDAHTIIGFGGSVTSKLAVPAAFAMRISDGLLRYMVNPSGQYHDKCFLGQEALCNCVRQWPNVRGSLDMNGTK